MCLKTKTNKLNGNNSIKVVKMESIVRYDDLYDTILECIAEKEVKQKEKSPYVKKNERNGSGHFEFGTIVFLVAVGVLLVW